MTKRLAAPPACWTKCFWPVVHVSKMGCGIVSRFSASDSNSWTGFGGSNLLEGILTKGMTMSSRGCNRVLTGEDGPLEVLDVFIVEILPVWVAYMHMMWTFYTTPWQKQPHHITIKEMFDILLRNEVAERLYEPIDSTCQLSQRPGNTRALQKWDLVYSHNNLRTKSVSVLVSLCPSIDSLQKTNQSQLEVFHPSLLQLHLGISASHRWHHSRLV